MNSTSPRSPFLVFLWVFLPVVLLGLLVARVGIEVAYAGRVYPGVQAPGLDLGGKTVEEAAAQLQTRLDVYGNQTVKVVAGDQTYVLTARALGFKPNAYAMATAAYQAGRVGDLASHLGGPLVARQVALPLTAEAIVDENTLAAAIDRIGARSDHHPVDAVLRLQPRVELTPSRAGQSFDRSRALNAARAYLADLRRDQLDLPVTALAPRVTTEQLVPIQAQARQILDQVVVLTNGQQRWPIPRDQLQSALVLRDNPIALDLADDAVVGQVRAIAQQLDQPSRDARLTIANGKATVDPDAAGQAVDQATTVATFRQNLLAGLATAPVVVQSVAPAVTKADLDPVALDAQNAMDRGLVLAAGNQQFQLSAADVGDLIVVKQAGDRHWTILLDPTRVANRLAQIDALLAYPKLGAHFGWDKGKVTMVEPDVPGVGIDANAATQVILEKWRGGQVDLPVVDKTIHVDDALLARLNQDLKEVFQHRETSFAGSIPERAHNIGLAMGKLNGTFVPPGGVFSFNQAIGPMTTAAGFQWGFAYSTSSKGTSQVVPAVAGGICQVATTLFQPVFWAGYEIDERHWHMFVMKHYADNGYLGLDATVSPDDNLDFKFINDTNQPMLILAGVTGELAHVDLIGTKPNWTVKVDPELITNVTPAPKTQVRTESPLFAKGRQIILEEAQQGLTAHDVRHVVYPDGHERTLRLDSVYQPSPFSILVGTG